MSYAIVDGSAERLDELAPLWTALVEHQGELNPILGAVRPAAESWPVKRSRHARWLERDDAFCLLAVGADDRIVGYAFVHPILEGALTWQAPVREAELEALAVLPEARGSGIGERLVDAVRERCRELGYDGLSLTMVVGNDGAGRFYERLGFRPSFLQLRDVGYGQET